jgi:FlaA1/EpsC-like NDP-sugar epimerase
VVGLRPGEKLREELVAMDEALIASGVDKIQRVQSGWIPELKFLHQNIERLENLAAHGQSRAVLELLFHLVPTFRPVGSRSAGTIQSEQARRSHLSKLRIADQSA